MVSTAPRPPAASPAARAGSTAPVARPGAHQGYLTLRAFIACGEALQILLKLPLRLRAWPLATSGETAAEGFLPETATLADRGQPLFDWPRQRPATSPSAPNWRAAAPPAFAQQPRQHRRWPLDDTATTSGERSMIDGKINEQRGWSSTTLANTRRLSASANTAAFSALSSVAAIARNTSSSCGGSKFSPARAVALADVVVPVPVRATAQLSVFQPRALKQIDFARSHVTAANDQHRTLFQIGEYW